ncbi:restriction endonuclease subunit S [Streptomyces sp. NBC_01766]|uniref:restriction endonuclease subunit S n=1 Tax=Streptomyces sp. NBC_01766 TaxID=2975936 RepID=UPI002DD9A8B4|nr:restriction endonuclease subunit S [Streptomyces sp. NBC_01766]WSC20895.1 restriction endonuclease subunit S [Streptomyces sp. NBC_01766]
MSVDSGEGGVGAAPIEGEVKLPDGWAWATVGEVLVRSDSGKSFKCEPRPASPNEWGIIKVSAMTWGEFRAIENKALLDSSLVNPDYEIRAGDVLVSRANTVDYVGAPVLVEDVRPGLLLSDKSLRFTPGTAINRHWFVHWLRSPVVRKAISAKASGTSDSMRNISQADLRAIKIPLPPTVEQHRIADALGARLAHLDEIDRFIARARTHSAALRKQILLDAIPEPDAWPEEWQARTVDQAGTVDLGRARHPDWHTGPKMRPYLRVANVFEDRIDTTSLMEMDFSEGFGKYRLLPGDVLLNEGQSPHLVGRPAMYKGIPEGVAFTNSLLRFRADADVLPGWALLVFRRHLHAGRFMREVRITTNIAHLSSSRLKAVEFPVPPLDEQRRLISETKGRLARADRLKQLLDSAETHTTGLRRALLTEAFAGRLVPQDPQDEPAEDLLKRIRIEREAAEAERREARRAATKARRREKQAAKPPGAASPPAPVSRTPLPEGEQTILSLEFTE